MWRIAENKKGLGDFRDLLIHMEIRFVYSRLLARSAQREGILRFFHLFLDLLGLLAAIIGIEDALADAV
jgi:hypothetical protein